MTLLCPENGQLWLDILLFLRFACQDNFLGLQPLGTNAVASILRFDSTCFFALINNPNTLRVWLAAW